MIDLQKQNYAQHLIFSIRYTQPRNTPKPKPNKFPTMPRRPSPSSQQSGSRNNGATYSPTYFPTTFIPTASPTFVGKHGQAFQGPLPKYKWVYDHSGASCWGGGGWNNSGYGKSGKPPSPKGCWHKVPYIPPPTEMPTTFMPTTFPPVSFVCGCLSSYIVYKYCYVGSIISMLSLL